MKRAADVFSKPEKRRKIAEEIVVKRFKTTSNLSKPKEIRNLKFEVSNFSDNDAIKLDSMRASIIMKITDKNGAFPSGFLTSLTKPLSSLIQTGNMRYSHSIIDQVENYGYTSYINTLLTSNNHQKNSYLTSELYYEDEKLEEISVNNKTMEARRLAFLGAHTDGLTLTEHLDLPLTNQDKYFVKQGVLGVELLLQDPKFWIMTAITNKVINYEIIDSYLEVDFVSGYQNAITKAIDHSCYYEVKEPKCVAIPLAVDTMSTRSVNLVTNSKLPEKLIIGLVKETSQIGTYDSNPYNFVSGIDGKMELEKIDFLINNEIEKSYKVNFKTGNYLEAYHSLFDVLGYTDPMNEITPPSINKDLFKDGYCLFGFKTPIEKTFGNLSIKLTFKSAPKVALSLITLAIYDNVITIE